MHGFWFRSSHFLRLVIAKRAFSVDPTVFFGQKVAIIKTKSAAIAFFSSPPFLLLALSLFPFLFLRVCFSFSVDVLVSAPLLLAFQLFAGQTIQLLYFCPKNEVVVVVVVCSFPCDFGVSRT